MKLAQFLIIAVLAIGSLSACESMTASPPPVAPAAQTAGTSSGEQVPELSLAMVTFSENGPTVQVEVAQSDEQKAKGLMGRESLPENYGMWFVFTHDAQDKFWMKDTLIPLDVIFISADYRVVDIVANTQPNSEQLFGSKRPYRYVLEVNAGFAARHDIKVGDSVQFGLGR